jgi:Uma2 family endonuclease
MMTINLRYTTSDLELLPEIEGTRYEIIDGELYVSRQPSLEHQYATYSIGLGLHAWSLSSRKGRAYPAPGVLFAPDQNVAPDIIWISHERLAAGRDSGGHLHVAPELAIEILSPGSTNERRDLELKLKLYSRQGVQEYWIVDWRLHTVQIYRRQEQALALFSTAGDGDTLSSPLLPDFSLRVDEIWEPTP